MYPLYFQSLLTVHSDANARPDNGTETYKDKIKDFIPTVCSIKVQPSHVVHICRHSFMTADSCSLLMAETGYPSDTPAQKYQSTQYLNESKAQTSTVKSMIVIETVNMVLLPFCG
jgi:V8-like Glu-specific endopeptidase